MGFHGYGIIFIQDKNETEEASRRNGLIAYLQLKALMAAAEKTKLVREIEAKIQSLNLLLSTLKADKSRKPESIAEFRKEYHELLVKKA